MSQGGCAEQFFILIASDPGLGRGDKSTSLVLILKRVGGARRRRYKRVTQPPVVRLECVRNP